MERSIRVVLVAVLMSSSSVASAASVARPLPDPAVERTHGFLKGHPDQRFRMRGLEARRQGQLAESRRLFMLAARYADKFSQAMLAEMLWTGAGTELDRALAYAWMDLAAERGTVALLAKREYYWRQLSAQERERSIREGRAIYAEFGDEVAKKRLERVMLRHARSGTGSRTGSVERMSVAVENRINFKYKMDVMDFAGGGIPGERYYAAHHWSPALYWQQRDAELKDLLDSSVLIGPLSN